MINRGGRYESNNCKKFTYNQPKKDKLHEFFLKLHEFYGSL